jgi:hypothetical protein
MAANYDAELTKLAAEILREAVQGYDPSDPGQWLANPVLAAWSTNMFGGLARPPHSPPSPGLSPP